VSDLGLGPALSAWESIYEQVTSLASGLSEAEAMRPARCAGWAVTDVLYHQLLDARRALRTFATPSPGPADRDHVSYWGEFRPGTDPGGEAAHARYVRIAASAYPAGTLAWEWRETAGAACRAGRACKHEFVSTQGHVLRLPDFVATLAVEAAVHYLDLTVSLPAAPPPSPAALALTSRVLAGLLGTGLPATWDDTSKVLKGTGREPLSALDRRLLADLAGRFPLFG
jgi:Mycothiol maleylpyruvate isomerase N-terminal domain